MTNNPYSKIKNNSILTASSEELVLLLYNGAIKFANQAIEAINKNRIQEAHNKILRVDDIVIEFIATLDHSIEVSGSMELLYLYIHEQLIEANIQKNTHILNEVIGLLREFRETWKEAMNLAKRSNVEQIDETLLEQRAL